MHLVQQSWSRLSVTTAWLNGAARIASVAVLLASVGQQCSAQQTHPIGVASAHDANRPVLTNIASAQNLAAASGAMPRVNQLTGLREAIERARTSLSAERVPNPSDAHKRLVAQMEAFEAYLGGVQSPNAQAWFKFLKWNELLREVAATKPNLRTLTDIEMGYRQNIPGLEYAPFQAMRIAIGNFVDAQRFGANPEGTVKLLDAQLERLLDLTAPDNDATELQRMRDLGLVAGYLTSSNQGPELVAAMRGVYAQPNARLMVGESFVNRAIGRPVNQPNPVNECILGTQVQGTSCLVGNLFAELLPQQNGVSIRLFLSGDFSSNNIGYNRGVKVYTTGYSPVRASKIITITPSGRYTQPATASTNLQSQINGIDHKLRIVRRIASRKADEQQPQANAIGQQRLQSRLANQFNSQVEQQLAESNVGLGALTQPRIELVRLGISRPRWGIQSTDSHVHADLQEADASQLAAPPAQRLLPPASDAVAEIHQSLPINLAATVLGGRTLHSWEMDDMVKQFTGSVPEELQKESVGEPWSLTFADHHPIEVEFADGQASISLRITQMTRGDQELNQPATITARYRPVMANGNLVFQRQGDVELEFVRAASGIRAVTLRSFLKGKFDKLFREQSEPRPLAIRTRMPNLPQLTIQNIAFNDGWAQVSIR